MGDHFCQGGYPSRQPYFEANQECQPACRVLNSQCGPDFKCHCRQGFHPTYLPAPILTGREPTLVFCQSLADLLLHNHSTANVSKGLDNMSPTDSNGTLIDVPKSYYPQDTELNPWMLAMWYRLRFYRLCRRFNLPDVQIHQSGGVSSTEGLTGVFLQKWNILLNVQIVDICYK